jgi:hypothetical protein
VSWTMLGVAADSAVPGGSAPVRPGGRGVTPRRGSKRVAGLAIVGTVLPVPIVGTLIGDLWAGRPLFPSIEEG